MVAETKLTFEALVTGAKPVLAKGSGYSGTSGRLDLTLTLEQPKPPMPPHKPSPDYMWRDSSGGGLKPRPGDIQRKKDESDEEYAEREAVVRRVAEQKDWDRASARFAQETERYALDVAAFERTSAHHRDRVMAYAQLVGIASVFGNTPVQVVITPLNQDMLPGFVVGLLSEPAEAPIEEGDFEEADDLETDDDGDE